MRVWVCMFVCQCVYICVCVCVRACVCTTRACFMFVTLQWLEAAGEGRHRWAEAAVRGAPGHLPSADPAPHVEVAGRRPP